MNLSSKVIEILKGKTLATAESCTGGSISARITSVPGASSVFSLGVCTYSDQQKHRILDVSEEDLSTYTAVSATVATQMAQETQENLANKVESIGAYAFYNCTSLTTMTVKATIPPTIQYSNTLPSNTVLTTIYVPSTSVEAYKAANVWKDYNIQAISE